MTILCGVLIMISMEHATTRQWRYVWILALTGGIILTLLRLIFRLPIP